MNSPTLSPNNVFSQIVIDPPWPKRKGGRRKVRPLQDRALYPASRCLDVFSREKREEWEQYGNQPNHFGETA